MRARSSRWQFLPPILFGTIFAVLSLMIFIKGNAHQLPIFAGSTILSFIFIGSAYINYGAFIDVNKDGIRIEHPFTAARNFPWNEIVSIGHVVVPGLRSTADSYLGIQLITENRGKHAKRDARNKKLCGHDILIPDIYEIPLTELIKLATKEWKKHTK